MNSVHDGFPGQIHLPSMGHSVAALQDGESRPLTYTERFWGKVKKDGDDGCWVWSAHKSEAGYGVFRLPYGGRLVKAHRLALMLATGKVVLGDELVLHSCDSPSCCNPRHLIVGTSKDNSRDRVDRGRSRSRRGEQHGCHKLTEEQVRSIRLRIDRGSTQAAVAREYGVHKTTVSLIALRKTWRHLDD